MYIVVNTVGRMYTVEIRQGQTSCDMKYFPLTLGGLIKAMHNKYCLRGGWRPSCAKCSDGDMEDDGWKMLQVWRYEAPRKGLPTVE